MVYDIDFLHRVHFVNLLQLWYYQVSIVLILLSIEQVSIACCIQSSSLQSHLFSSSSFLLRLCRIRVLFSVVSLLIQKSPCYRNVVGLELYARKPYEIGICEVSRPAKACHCERCNTCCYEVRNWMNIYMINIQFH